MFGVKHLFNDTANFKLLIDGVQIDRVNCTKFLGVIVDTKLIWTDHITLVVSKVAKGVGALNRARGLLPRKLLLLIYYSMIYPHISYCNIVWGAASANQLHRLTLLQKRAIRIISNSQYLAHTSLLFANLKLFKLSDINIYQSLQFLYKLKFFLLPQSCLHLVQIAPTKLYSVRAKPFFMHNVCRTSHREQDISFRGPVIWNSLPTSISTLFNISAFNSSIRTFIFSKYNI